MRSTVTCTTFFSLCLIPLAAPAQSEPNPQSDQQQPAVHTSIYEAPNRPGEAWNRVRELTHDEQITVWASHNRHVRCLFTGATEDYLFCEPAFSRWHSSQREYHFNRTDVDKVRLEQSERNFKTTVIATGIAGAIAGSALTDKKNGPRVLGGIFGGLGGTMAGLIIGIPVAIFVPGQLVYERPRIQRPTHARLPEARTIKEAETLPVQWEAQ